jgi:hypothetical protein
MENATNDQAGCKHKFAKADSDRSTFYDHFSLCRGHKKCRRNQRTFSKNKIYTYQFIRSVKLLFVNDKQK